MTHQAAEFGSPLPIVEALHDFYAAGLLVRGAMDLHLRWLHEIFENAIVRKAVTMKQSGLVTVCFTRGTLVCSEALCAYYPNRTALLVRLLFVFPTRRPRNKTKTATRRVQDAAITSCGC